MKSKQLVVLPLLLSALLISGCSPVRLSSQEILRESNALPDGSKISITISESTWCAEIARSDAAKQQGLSGRASLPSRGAMLFLFDQAAYPTFWMKDTLFDLDFVWISNDAVVDISRDVQHPRGSVDDASLPRYTPKTPVTMVLEVPAGEAREIREGDRIIYNQTCAEIPSS